MTAPGTADTTTDAPPTATRAAAALARLETRRYLSSPFLAGGLALTGLSMYLWLRSPVADPDGVPGYPALFIGVFGIAIGFGLNQSLQGASETLDVTPTPAHIRTAAMSLTALIPFGFGVLSLLAVLGAERLHGPTYGTFSATDRFTLLAGQIAVSGLGGPLLGIAVARWFQAWWVVPILIVLISVWVVVVDGLTVNYPNSFPIVLLRLFSPYSYFLDSPDSRGQVATWRGSPEYFLGWQLCLCALALTVALLRDAPPATRRRLQCTLLVLVPVATALYVLAATGGLSHALVSYPDGTIDPW